MSKDEAKDEGKDEAKSDNSTGTHPVLSVRDLHKTFRIGFLRKKVEAVRGLSFEVQKGEVFGLLGPNGAGKTTTIKMVLRLIFPQKGEISLFGENNPGKAEMARLGYLPENPYIYQYLRPLEFLDLCGRLTGLDRRERLARGKELVEQVGLAHAIDRPIGKFSKGMMQRIGVAQALLHDPELLILDEPMSGLDPIGRKEVRDLILGERDRGKTIIFTSHILSDVERLCDRVAIMRRGKITHHGKLDELLRGGEHVEVELTDADEGLRQELAPLCLAWNATERGHRFSTEDPDQLMKRALAGGARIVSVEASKHSLEELFIQDAREQPEQPLK